MELEDETFLFNQTGPVLMFDNSSLNGIDLTLDGTVDGYDNFSYGCIINNFTYLNVTCEPTFELSLPLLGELYFYKDIPKNIVFNKFFYIY